MMKNSLISYQSQAIKKTNIELQSVIFFIGTSAFFMYFAWMTDQILSICVL